MEVKNDLEKKTILLSKIVIDELDFICEELNEVHKILNHGILFNEDYDNRNKLVRKLIEKISSLKCSRVMLLRGKIY